MHQNQGASPFALAAITAAAAASDPFIGKSVGELLDFTTAPTSMTNPLRELMAAERMLLGAGANAMAYRAPIKRGSGDVAANRLREKRRQKAKQASRRLKAARS